MTEQSNKITVKCEICGVDINTTKNKDGKPNKKQCGKCSFERVAEYRTCKSLDMIRLLGNLTSGQYTSDKAQWDMIIGALVQAVQELDNKRSNRKADEKTFSLKPLKLEQQNVQG